jgi:hypothetical protein
MEISLTIYQSMQYSISEDLSLHQHQCTNLKSGQSVRRRLSISLAKHATVFQAEVYVILACVHEIETKRRLEKYVSIYSDSQTALRALQTANTMSLLV